MIISAISGAPSVAAVQPSAPSRASSSLPAQESPAATAVISKAGDLMNKLQQLQQKDPVKFKELMAQLSGDAKTAAGSESGEESGLMTKLADSLAQPASSGSLAAVKPHVRAHSHHPTSHPAGTGSAMHSFIQSALDKVNQALGIDPQAPESAQPMAQ